MFVALNAVVFARSGIGSMFQNENHKSGMSGAGIAHTVVSTSTKSRKHDMGNYSDRFNLISTYLAPCVDCGETVHLQMQYKKPEPNEPHMMFQCTKCHATFVCFRYDTHPEQPGITETFDCWNSYMGEMHERYNGASIIVDGDVK